MGEITSIGGFYGDSELPDGAPLTDAGVFSDLQPESTADEWGASGDEPAAARDADAPRGRGNSRLAARPIARLVIPAAAFSERTGPTAASPYLAEATDLHHPLSAAPAINDVNPTTNYRPVRFGQASI